MSAKKHFSEKSVQIISPYSVATAVLDENLGCYVLFSEIAQEYIYKNAIFHTNLLYMWTREFVQKMM